MLADVHTKHSWFAVAVAIAVASPVPPRARADAPPWEREAAQSDQVERAEAYAAEAFAAYGKKDYTGAISLYMKALAASPSADILFNVARIYDTKLGDRELASKFYRRYIAEPGAEPDRVRMANERLLVLRQLERAEQQQRASGGPGSARLPNAGEDRTSVRYPRQPPPEPEGMSGRAIAGIAVGAAGLVGLGVGTGFGFAAKSEADVVKAECDGNQCSQRGLDEAEEARQAADISTIAFIAGGSLAAIGTGLLIWGLRTSDRDDTARLQVAPFAGAGALGTQLTGRW